MRLIERRWRANPETIFGAVLLIIAAASVALNFRTLPPAVDLRQMTWDAASHALIGLDLFDHLRRLELHRFVLRLQEEHWWPPLFGVLSLPAYLVGGRQLSSPSLVSLVSYCLTPAVAWLSIRRVTNAVPVLVWGLVAAFFLRSPMLLEMSTWSMLEPVAGLVAVAAFWCFLAEPGSRSRNWAYGLAGASTLLKYHYGFFLLVTLGAATLAELTTGERQTLFRTVRERLRRKSTWAPPLMLLVAAIAARLSISNLIWITYFTLLVVAIVRWMRTKQAPWAGLPLTVQRFITCGLSWPLIWCIDPANLRAWYRELGVAGDPPATWTEQIRSIWRFILYDYCFGSVVLTIVFVGVALTIVEGIRRKHAGLLALALHPIWSVLLMSLSRLPLEQRFIGSQMPVLYVAAALGWTLFVQGLRTPLRLGLAGALLIQLASEQNIREIHWNRDVAFRRVYHYASSDPPDGFVRETVAAFSTGQPVLIILPNDIAVVTPTIRLGIRLAARDIRPDLIDVEGGGTAVLSKRLRRFRGGLIGIETDAATMHRLVEEAGLKVVSDAPGPPIPRGRGTTLHISGVRR